MTASRPDRPRFHQEARRSAYDVVVVGSGIGGLTAAALLAGSGRSVLVVERHDRLGGYAHAFRRGPYRFDSAVHMVGGCGPGGLIRTLTETLGVAERCAFVPVAPCYTATFPDLTVAVPAGLEAFADAHARAFPAGARGLAALLARAVDVRRELRAAAELRSPLDTLATPARFPALGRYRRATLAAVMEEHLESARLRAVLATLWPFLGLPPSQLSFLYFASMLLSYVDDGASYCRGTFQTLANALGEAVRRAGGEILLRSVVRRIRVAAGRVAGVVLENGQRIDALAVVSNADLRQTVEELVGAEAFPARYVAKLRRMRRSVSACVVYLATDCDPAAYGLGHETFVYAGWDHEEAARRALAGEPTWFSITVPTLSDPTLAPAGEHVMILTTLVPDATARDWRREKERYTDWLVAAAARRIPGLAGHLRFVEGATPRTMERYTRNDAGAVYGWAVTPDQVGAARPGTRTPLDGLVLAGHWTQPGGGVYGVVASGVQAARAVLGTSAADEWWPRLSA